MELFCWVSLQASYISLLFTCFAVKFDVVIAAHRIVGLVSRNSYHGNWFSIVKTSRKLKNQSSLAISIRCFDAVLFVECSATMILMEMYDREQTILYFIFQAYPISLHETSEGRFLNLRNLQ